MACSASHNRAPDVDRRDPNEMNSARIRPSKMSEQFFYVHLKFIPKIVTLTVTILRQREVVVEVSKRLVQHSHQNC